MLVPVEINEEMPVELKNASNDLLRVATKGMMSWAEKNHKQKLIELLYKMGYYKYNQTIFVNTSNEEN